MRTLGIVIVVLTVLSGVFAPFVAPNRSGEQFRDLLFAPPMRPHVIDDAGTWHAPFVYPLRVVDRLERRYEEDRVRRVRLEWFSGGKLFRAEDSTPILLLGADSLGRDVFSRLIEGGRISLGIAVIAAFGALLIGALAGAVAGYAGGAADEVVMRFAEFVLVLPTIYVVLALRAVMPLVLPASILFVLMSTLLALVGWPYVARGVRAILAAESAREYAAAAISIGAGHPRLLLRHLLPATRGFLMVQAMLLLPAFILAEATLSYVGLGFAEPTPSWGSMLREAANIRALADFPWLLSPAAAIVTFVLAVNMVMRPARGGDALAVALNAPSLFSSDRHA